jgi:Outer membrane protein beta-barrel domain
MKYIVTFFLFQCLVQSAICQDSINLRKDYPKRKVNAIEFLFGPSSSTIRGLNESVSYAGGGGSYYSSSVSNKVGFSINLGLIQEFNKHFALYTRIAWEMKGVQQKTDSLSLSPSTGALISVTPVFTNQINNDYILVSVIPELLLGKNSNFNVGAGGYFGILEGSRITYQYFYSSQGSSNTPGNFDKYDFGFSFNCGYDFSLTNNLKLTIQANSNYGITQISSSRINMGLPAWYNTSYSILIGLRFLGSKSKFFKF